MRIDGAGADPGKVLKTPETAGPLQSAHVNSVVAQNLTRRAAERSREKSVGKFAARLSDGRHDGRKIDVEPEHAQHFARDPAQGAHTREIAMLANRAGR